MRLLYLTNGFPYPLTSGYLRHYFLIKELSRHHAVSLLAVTDTDVAPQDVAALRPFTECVMTFTSARRRGSLPQKAVRRLRTLTQPSPAVQEMRNAVERLVKEKRFDAVISGKRTLPAIQSLPGLPLIADMCDATSMRIRRSMRYASPLRMPFLVLQYAQMLRAERELMNRANHTLFISCRDREALLGSASSGRKNASYQTTIVPNGVDLDFWQRSSPTLGRNTIVFTGAMNYRPNVDAALYLINEILPLVQQAVPEAQLLIVGRDPTPPLIDAGQESGVTVTGFVEDVRPYLEQATVFAAPIRFGAGIQNKMLEAMAMAVPVVASPLAADGLRTEEGEQPPVQIADGQQPFAEQLIQTLIERGNNPAPDIAARCFVTTHFTWNHSGARLQKVIGAVVNGGRGA